ncbi:MAG: type II toxin-antitoxin system RelE/ParE family toxin [Alphaproteobacteria bacterium]|nr:type II toxin-antitoxin system RelE/ParE family toxin [Alphaproteobacteria bacterium]
MRYDVKRSTDTDRDIAAIFDFLTKSYLEFGNDRRTALEAAAARVREIETAMLSLGKAPHQGTLRPELLPGLRSVTKERAIFYFDVDDDRKLVRVLAIFFGGQDHQRLMLRRLLGA